MNYKTEKITAFDHCRFNKQRASFLHTFCGGNEERKFILIYEWCEMN